MPPPIHGHGTRPLTALLIAKLLVALTARPNNRWEGSCAKLRASGRFDDISWIHPLPRMPVANTYGVQLFWSKRARPRASMIFQRNPKVLVLSSETIYWSPPLIWSNSGVFGGRRRLKQTRNKTIGAIINQSLVGGLLCYMLEYWAYHNIPSRNLFYGLVEISANITNHLTIGYCTPVCNWEIHLLGAERGNQSFLFVQRSFPALLMSSSRSLVSTSWKSLVLLI